MKINAIECPKCHDIIFSRVRHDYRSCSCSSIAIDGGFDYTKVSFDPDIDPNAIKSVVLELDVTRAILYDDWNYSKDEFGKISGTSA